MIFGQNGVDPKQISPVLTELAEDYKEKILVAKVNIDENPEVHLIME